MLEILLQTVVLVRIASPTLAPHRATAHRNNHKTTMAGVRGQHQFLAAFNNMVEEKAIGRKLHMMHKPFCTYHFALNPTSDDF
jgi:hypothetical protein